MLQTELYKVFYIVTKHGNISEAAKELYISQPAVSKSIKKLEELTGCTLFIRSSKGVSLTSEGKILYDYVEKAFDHLITGEKIINKINNLKEGLVKIGISNTLCQYFFMPHLKSFHKSYPEIKIQVINRSSPDTLKLLQQGIIDFGIISIPNTQDNITFIELMKIHDIFVTNDQNLVRKKLSIETLNNLHLMMLEKKNLTRKYIDEFVENNSLHLTPKIEISSMDFLIEFAKIGLGVASVIKEFVAPELAKGTLYEIPISPTPPPRKIGIVVQKNIPLTLAANSFIEHIKNEIP
ncbi:DNA-binding transcriptional LysR family regulator [Natranaerovirga pectinivora]|uniref:DNA-binding transcriptional LysR family regulator n=1 Tax=Natranaerovirga pectinivora TaxID=682400 RepID=A0A4V2V0G5_9FIRM|nr:LysR family transcriptional regulator [Natranaerovirga pectinivora]TCT16037.1 DNA-binding transcriptional LysR family regulator [Natranaerovirga pectinivora]